MALRPIDNALPTVLERPKKQAKVAVSVQKQADIGVNDENKAAPLPAADASVEYIASENLSPIPDPQCKIQSLIEGIDSKDWIKVCESLNNSRRFAVYHSTFLLPILEKVLLVAVKAMKNPRSALCKTAIMACSDIFKAYGDKLLDFPSSDAFDQVLLQLVLKASQDKKFVCEEADRALKAMVASITPLPLLHKLKVYVGHANLRVRAKVAVSISSCASKMGLEDMEKFGLVSLVQMAVDLLNDRLPDARDAARSLVTSVYEAFVEREEQKQEAWQIFCQSNLQAINAQALVKIVTSQHQ